MSNKYITSNNRRSANLRNSEIVLVMSWDKDVNYDRFPMLEMD